MRLAGTTWLLALAIVPIVSWLGSSLDQRRQTPQIVEERLARGASTSEARPRLWLLLTAGGSVDLFCLVAAAALIATRAASRQERLLHAPFFSTKFTGRGLGLAAALGIVRGTRGNPRFERTGERNHLSGFLSLGAHGFGRHWSPRASR